MSNQPNPIYVDFVVRRVSEVQKALKSIADTAVALETRSTTAAKSGASERQRVRDREAREKIRAMQQADRMVAAAQRAGLKEVEKRAKAERDVIARSAREMQAIRERSASMAGRFA